MTGLVLGTAQLGHPYGLTNEVGRLSDAGVAELLGVAVASGIRTVDTAEAYGDAEDRLGALMPSEARVGYVTKVALPPVGESDVPDRIAASLARLRVSTLHGLLLHRVADLVDGRHPLLLTQLRAARDAGLVRRVGVSVYDADDLELVLEVFPDLDLLQFPGSVVDRRLLENSRIGTLAARGVECHVRSVFLQGLLLQDPAALAPRFAALGPALLRLDEHARERGVDRLALLLAAVRVDEVAGVVVGATGAGELQQIVRSWDARAEPVRGVDTVDPALLDPRAW
ncbi:MAG: aldo/keto reductase [Microbacteriaceae bacterium]|nr:aldo/keto reductase [Microbacteriaceae bacterium]